ncbi:MAG: apolipoprotein N-acyltransferase [Bacteroidota bacterium]
MHEVAPCFDPSMKNLNIHIKLTGLSVCMALLLTLAWHPIGLFPLAFFGFVPLFYIHYLIQQKQLGAGWAFLYGYLSFLLFNVGTTWWVWNASAGGGLMAFILNSLLMNLPFMFLFHLAKKTGNPLKLLPFICAWLAFEFFHYRWDGTWTWLSLGNVFANVPWLIQWYEYTGVAGGTLWILWVNKSIFHLLVAYPGLEKQQRLRKAFNLAFFQLFAPVFLSFYVLNQFHDQQKNYIKNTARVMVVQPNIDPYKDKFNGLSPYQQMVKMLGIAEANMDSTVQLVMFPETALVGQLDERTLAQEQTVFQVREFMKRYPNVSILTGADTYKIYFPGDAVSATARQYKSGTTYDSYNTALFFKSGDSTIDVYHKSKLVPGVERLPFSAVLKYVEKYAINLGGTSGSLGVDKEPKTFFVNRVFGVAPIICYESIFGEYITGYVQRGATLLCIITNDGWWDDTPGYIQHNEYARLRAIETRRYVARSANTGISSFIDDEGGMLAQTGWYKGEALKYDVVLNQQKTFYVEYGDLIYQIGVLMAAFLLFTLFSKRRQLV